MNYGRRTYTMHERWANWLALALTVLALLSGLLLRDGVLKATTRYEDPSEGIAAARPAGWLVEHGAGYVFRLRDPKARPFKTALQVTVLTVGPDATGRNVFDTLTLRRSAVLSGYRVLDMEETGALPKMRYVYVASEPDPFLGTLPVVVMGVDVVYFKSNQAIVATYQASVADFEAQYFRFERFVDSLRY